MVKKQVKTKVEYYDDGTIKRVYAIDKNGNEQGPFEAYHENGQLKAKCTFKNGEKEGLCEFYFDNAQLNLRYTTKNGKLNGLFECYYKNGQLSGKAIFKNGKQVGPNIEYWKNGQLEVKCIYSDGKKDGPYERYREDGSLAEWCVFKMGKKLTGSKALDYLKEWKAMQEKKYLPIKLPAEQRKELNARLAQMDKQMAPTQLRQNAKRSEIARFRAKYQNQCNSR